MRPSLSRLERFDRVGSTNDVVRGWLGAGVPEVCVAVAARQTAGRGRHQRDWVAPDGAGLLLSLGFRPGPAAPEWAWRHAACVALAMAEAAESIVGLPAGTIRLKWPNDLVVESVAIRKLAGLLSETVGLGTDDARLVVGIGVNADWAAADFPPELAATMTSLREIAGDRPIDREALLERFLPAVMARIQALRAGGFDDRGWADRQVTTGRTIRLEGADGRIEVMRAVGVDGDTGALLVEDAGTDDGPVGAGGAGGGVRSVVVGEIRHVRLDARVTSAV